jgi:histidyl-tRNA synthetase
MDYYTRTVFEIKPKGSGSQGTVLGGGRYDGLIQQLGGKATPGIGFGSGLERLVLNLEKNQIDVTDNVSSPIVVAYHGDDCVPYVLEVVTLLRSEGVRCVLAPSGKSIKSQMRYAASLKAKSVLIAGEEEVSSRSVAVRNMLEGNQETVRIEELTKYLTTS